MYFRKVDFFFEFALFLLYIFFFFFNWDGGGGLESREPPSAGGWTRWCLEVPSNPYDSVKMQLLPKFSQQFLDQSVIFCIFLWTGIFCQVVNNKLPL